jgi:hypothetical protein
MAFNMCAAPMIEDLHKQREKNLRAMRSPASIALAFFSIAIVALICIFHDHPLMQQPQIVASLIQRINAP